MNSSIISQVNIDLENLLGFSNAAVPKKMPAFEAQLTNEHISSKNANTTALLQISIAETQNLSQIKAALKLLSKEFKAINIYLDMQLALLVYSIILPYMPEDEVQHIVAKKKQDWVTQNIKFISAATTPWSIITSEEQIIQKTKDSNILKLNKLFKHDISFNKKIKTDTAALKDYLFKTHGITDAIYNQATHRNDSAMERYLITKIATIAAMHSFKNTDYAYITPVKMSSYSNLQEVALLQYMPPCLTLNFTEMSRSEEPLTSTELNQSLHNIDLLGKISARQSYLEHSVKHFPGNAYVESLNGTFISCNDQQAISFGLKDKSYIEGQAFAKLLPKDQSDMIEGVVTDIVSKDETELLLETVDYLGEKSTWLSIKMPLRNKKNIPIGIIGFSIEIKDKDEIQKLKSSDNIYSPNPVDVMPNILSSSEEEPDNKTQNTSYIASMVEKMPGNVFWQDTHGKILGCNQNQAELLGLDSPKEAIGIDSSSFLTTSHAKEAVAELAEIAQTGEPITKEELYNFNGKIVAMRSHKTAIRGSSGKVIGIMVVALDISKNKQQLIKLEQEKEQLELANKFKKQFIKDIEQDMRTPFAGLCNMTKLCASKENNVTKKQQLLEISSCAKDLLAYCDSLLEFSRNESFKSNNNLISLKDLVGSVVSANITALHAKGLKFEKDFDNNIPSHIIADSYRLRRILSNLLSNAIKYTEKGHIKLAIKLESSEEGKSTVSFTVTDTGIGINKEDQQHIFNKYNMLNASRGYLYGQGLGLSEVKRFVEDLKGNIFIDSDLGSGTSITVKLSFEIELAVHKGQI